MRTALSWTRTSMIFAILAGAVIAQDPARPGADRPAPGGRPAGPDEDGPPPPPPPPPFGPPANPLLIAMDTNDDGELSAEEIKKAPETLKTLDRNKDGKLSEIEFRPPPPPGQRGPRQGPEAFLESVLRFDADKDGKLTAKELPERMRRLLDEGDTNSDGVLDRAEIARIARRMPRPAPPRGDEPPPPPDQP